MAEKRFIKKRFSFTVDTANTSYSKKFELDKNIKLVRGLQISSNKPNQLFYRGSQKIEVNGEEIFPEDYESKLLMSGINVAPDDKFADLGDGVVTGNGEIKMVFKDTPNSAVAFEAYEVSLYMICELG